MAGDIHDPGHDTDHDQHGCEVDDSFAKDHGEAAAERNLIAFLEHQWTNDFTDAQWKRIDEEKANAEHAKTLHQSVLWVVCSQNDGLPPCPNHLLRHEETRNTEKAQPIGLP